MSESSKIVRLNQRAEEAFHLKSDWGPAGDQPTAITQLVEGLNDGLSHQTLLGVTGSGKTFTIANVIAQVQRPTLIMAPNKTLAGQLYGEFKEFFPNNAVEYFVSYYDYYQPEAYVPSSDTYIEKDSAINEHIEQMRLSATKALITRKDAIIIASVSAIYGLGDPDAYFQMVLHLIKGERLPQRDLIKQLTAMQYSRNEVALERGTYRVRGEIIDIHPAESDDEAVRVELFDDEIEQLSFFDPLTGEVKRKVPRLTIFPKSHYVTPRERTLGMIESIRVELQTRIKHFQQVGKLIEAQRIEQRTQFDLEMIQEIGYCKGVENYSRYLSGRGAGQPPPTLFDYLPPDALVVLDESHVTVPQIGAMYKGDRSRKETLVEFGFRLPSALDNRPLKFEEFEKICPQTIHVSATPGPYEINHSQGAIAEQVVRPTGLVDPEIEIRPAGSQVDDVLGEIRLRADRQERVLITVLTKRMAEDLTDYLNENGVRVRYMHSDVDTVERAEIVRDLRLGVFDVLVGINLLREGLDIPGRAARHLTGRAILYADRVTGSMQRAIDETHRRREKQVAFNLAHGITPRGIVKRVQDVMRLGYEDTAVALKAAEAKARYDVLMPPELIAKKIGKLEKEMKQAALNLEFEKAAKLRDELRKLREQAIVHAA